MQFGSNLVVDSIYIYFEFCRLQFKPSPLINHGLLHSQSRDLFILKIESYCPYPCQPTEGSRDNRFIVTVIIMWETPFSAQGTPRTCSVCICICWTMWTGDINFVTESSHRPAQFPLKISFPSGNRQTITC